MHKYQMEYRKDGRSDWRKSYRYLSREAADRDMIWAESHYGVTNVRLVPISDA